MSARRWVVASPDGHVKLRTDPATYEAIKTAVGGWLEVVPTNGKLTIYCDEEGKLKGLRLNRIATLFVAPFLDDLIVGPVVFIGPPDDEGEDTDLPPEIEEQLADITTTYGFAL